MGKWITTKYQAEKTDTSGVVETEWKRNRYSRQDNFH